MLSDGSESLACQSNGSLPNHERKVASVERVVQIFRSFEDAEQADDQFYADLTPEERLDILLELVERHRRALGEAASRFERVHRVVELQDS